ncbi:hypothetical protein [Desulfoplanes formicivorans]|uniref:hypothetical protein n=1 Tax=Desulfoplanes formicivorans TaxID=1592317 RepID=UPI000A796A50|nr:hypothetical protein [Desulfoplanes formicivorans]
MSGTLRSSWKSFFSDIETSFLQKTENNRIDSLEKLKVFLDLVQTKYCLIKPFFQHRKYPLVEPRELLPSFESDMYEHPELPGFSMIAFDRPLSYFNEIFQFDILHSPADEPEFIRGETCPLELSIHARNVQVFLDRLPKKLQENFKKFTGRKDLTCLDHYGDLLPFLTKMDRAHVMALDAEFDYYLAGVYASFPSDIDAELKRFGLRIGKFAPNDNETYERNRDFVYQFLMELYGFPVVSERRTSAALFARRLYKSGERFLIRVLGQSDRTITTYYPHPDNRGYPRVEKLALVDISGQHRDVIEFLRDHGFFIHPQKKAIILRVTYIQHKYERNNVREDRALSVLKQEIIHPRTGACCTSRNIVKDTYSMTLQLNDIVRGEFKGKIKYKKHEIVENTDTHSNRLKFLHAWLNKHQRRIIGYSDDFYANVNKVLDHYLTGPGSSEYFAELRELYQEVRSIYSYIQQARKIQYLENLCHRNVQGRRISYKEMLEEMINTMADLKFEIVQYFDHLVVKAIAIGETTINDRYLHAKYLKPKEETLSSYGMTIRKLYGRLVSQIDELKAIRKTRMDTHEKSI